MKKYLKIVLSFVLVLSLTGCVKYNMNMEVKSDKSVDLELIYAIDYSGMSQFGDTDEAEAEFDEGINVDDYDFLSQKGFKVEQFKDESNNKKYTGIKITKTYKTIDDITKEEDKTIDINKVLGDAENFDDSQFFSKKGNTYKASLLFDFNEGSGDEETMDMGSMADSFELKYTIKLPAKAKTNNATEVSKDGKTLTWNLKYGEKNQVDFTFDLGNNSNTLMYVGIGVAALVIVGAVVIVLSKKKNNNPQA